MDAKEKVLDLLKKTEQALKAGEIAEKTGLSKPDVDKAMKQLKTEELIVSPKRCMWTAK
jgi:DNA-binding transcriptional regulator GbsR (MarR family)